MSNIGVDDKRDKTTRDGNRSHMRVDVLVSLIVGMKPNFTQGWFFQESASHSLLIPSTLCYFAIGSIHAIGGQAH